MRTRKRRAIPYLLAGPGALWLVLFFAVPMYLMARLSLESGDLGSGFRFTWEWANYSEVISLYETQFLRSFVYAGAATLIALLIGYPLAYTIAFRAGRWKNAMLIAVIAPFLTTYLIRTLAWETILADEGPVVTLLRTLGVLGDDGRLLATGGAVIAGIAYNFLPFMVLPIYASLERLDPRMIEAAKDLYASPRAAFLRVTLPLSAPGVMAGTLLTLIPATGDYVNAFFLGGPQNHMLGNAIQGLYLTQLDYPNAAALSFALMAVTTTIVVVYIRLAGSRALAGDEATT